MALPPIRPDAFAAQPTAGASADAARSAAQRAFFDAALGRTGAPVQAQAPTQAQAQAATAFTPTAATRAQRLPDPSAEPPAKPLRPGSLLDIRV